MNSPMTPLDQTLVDQMKSALSKSAPDVSKHMLPQEVCLGKDVFACEINAKCIHLYKSDGADYTDSIFLNQDQVRAFEQFLVQIGWRCS